MTQTLPAADLITEGAHPLRLNCPECSAAVVFQVEVTGQLTVRGDSGGRLRPVLSTKSVEHSCSDDGDAAAPLFGPGADTPDAP
jgi:hypothetical protein